MKRMCMFLLVLLFGFNISVFANSDSLSDLRPHHQFYDEMTFLKNKGVITGYPDSTFRPDQNVTRAEAAIMLGRVFDLNGEQRKTDFSDVAASHKASGFIESAVAKGFIKGFPDGTYRPDETVTRGQMAILLSRAFELTAETTIPFTDVSSSMSSYQHIKRIVAANITQGYPDNTYRPDGHVTRSQYSAFLSRALNDDFKVQLPVLYTKDMNKTFTYQTKEFGKVRYIYPKNDYPDWNLWYIYDDQDVVTVMVERQDHEGYKVGLPYSEYTLVLKHPIEKGHRWDIVYGEDEYGNEDVIATYEILATDLTLTTPAGTFNHVVEVTNLNGWTAYFAPNMGIIKQVSDGEVVYELIAVEDR